MLSAVNQPAQGKETCGHGAFHLGPEGRGSACPLFTRWTRAFQPGKQRFRDVHKGKGPPVVRADNWWLVHMEMRRIRFLIGYLLGGQYRVLI